MFVDEVRAQMPSIINRSDLDWIKHDIMETAKEDGHEYVIFRYNKDAELKEELEWLEKEGFSIEIWDTKDSPDGYLAVTISW